LKDHDGRTVPLATDVAQTLARLRPDDAREEDLVFFRAGWARSSTGAADR
jgi:hypothetical protein